MRLLLLRHAKAEKGGPGVDDRDRALNPRGRTDAARIGAYMAHHGLLPGGALVSPARRTRETFERLNEALPTSGLAVIDFPGDDSQKLHPRSGRLERFVTPRLLRAAAD